VKIITRQEVKYLISRASHDALLRDLANHLVPNKFFAQTIHNVYFDNDTNDLILRSIEKKEFKDKLRLRAYHMDGELGNPLIELKKKYKGTSYKRRIKLTIEQARDLINGGALNHTGQIADEMRFLIARTGCTPKMYIGYDRASYDVVGHDDLRITFDSNVRCRTTNLDFAPNPADKNIIDADHYILEIKAADTFPLWLTDALTRNGIFPQSFSKYARAFVCTEAIPL